MHKTVATKEGGVDVELNEKEILEYEKRQTQAASEKSARLEKETTEKTKSDALKVKLKSSLNLTDDEIETFKKL